MRALGTLLMSLGLLAAIGTFFWTGCASHVYSVEVETGRADNAVTGDADPDSWTGILRQWKHLFTGWRLLPFLGGFAVAAVGFAIRERADSTDA